MISEINITFNRFSKTMDVECKEGKKEIQHFYINTKILKDFLKSSNISFDGIKNKLLDKGVLERSSQGRFTHQTTVNGKMQNLIKFNLLKENITNELPF